jgi:hypothetical protein
MIFEAHALCSMKESQNCSLKHLQIIVLNKIRQPQDNVNVANGLTYNLLRGP